MAASSLLSNILMGASQIFVFTPSLLHVFLRLAVWCHLVVHPHLSVQIEFTGYKAWDLV